MNEEKSKVERLNESLYSRNYKDPENIRSQVSAAERPDVATDFNSPSLDAMLQHERRKTENHPVMKKMFTFALVFCVAAAAVAGYIYLGGGNLISSKNVDISILGPVTIAAGAPLDLGITISNKNNADLTSVNLIVQYPDGTRAAEDSTKIFSKDKILIGEVPAGSSVTRSEKAILFGQKGDVKTITISIDYKVKGSNATFSKEKIYEIKIDSAPVTIEVIEPPSVSSGDTFTTTLSILANSSEVLKDILIRAEYPYGYTVVDATPKPKVDDNVWSLGDLSPGDKKTITIKGRLIGENEEERTFRFYAGVGSIDTPDKFDSTLALVSETVSIDRSPLVIGMKLNGEDAENYIAPSGRVIQGTVTYKSNLPTTVLGGKIQIRLGGSALDRSTVVPQGGGFYNSLDNTITWDSSNSPVLATLEPGASGQLSFSFSSLNPLPQGAKNNEITLDTTFTANASGGETQNFLARATSAVKIASEVTLNAKALYSRGPFKNTGDIPPKAEKPTTYTLVFDLGNTQNDISNSKVTTTLGPNVTWLGKTSPTSENISYDQTTNTVTWTPGILASGAGFSTPTREAVFQVSLVPSLGQVGSAPVLVSNISFSGTDSFTNTPVNFSIPAVTTRITSDPAYVQGDEIVVK